MPFLGISKVPPKVPRRLGFSILEILCLTNVEDGLLSVSTAFPALSIKMHPLPLINLFR